MNNNIKQTLTQKQDEITALAKEIAEKELTKIGYFYICPRELFDKEEYIAAHLLGEIINLTQKEGYCFASNEYLSKKIKKSLSTVTRKIKTLEKLGFIKCEYEKKQRNTVRRIFIHRKF